jgi:hypothetical protein
MAVPLLATSTVVERWRDMGPVLWVIAALALVLWLMLLAALAMRTEPRRVRAGAPTLEPGGAEPPAVVNLMTNDWVLGREAVPATLLDLAARRFLSVDWMGEQTFVRVREYGPEGHDLTGYETLVLDHLRTLSAQTTDGYVPAEALTTGPEAVATGWWRHFERGVVDDARARGLSRARYGSGARTLLTVTALVVGLAVGIAASTLKSSGEQKDDDPVAFGVSFGVLSAALLVGAGSKLRGERDTIVGRDAAGRWLGLRTMLSNDPLFASQPPAAVSIWDRMMSYGAAMGVARTAVQTLPFGAESEHQAWSPVGGRWRSVRIRYPRRVPPGYGRHPALVALVGLVALLIGIAIFPAAISLADALIRSIDDLTKDSTTPAGLRVTVSIVLAVVVTAAALVALVGAAMLVAGLGDLARGRRSVEGRVLRLRTRGDDQHRFWHLAVDDGTTDDVRAWRLSSSPPTHQGATVRARVSPWLRHVVDLVRIEPSVAGVGVSVPTATPRVVAPLPAGAAAPSLPDATAIATALGVPAMIEAAAVPYPLAIEGASRTFVTQDGGRIITAWIPLALVDTFREHADSRSTSIVGLGDEAYRSALGGGLVVALRGHALMVAATLPGRTAEQDDAATEAVARMVSAHSP